MTKAPARFPCAAVHKNRRRPLFQPLAESTCTLPFETDDKPDEDRKVQELANPHTQRRTLGEWFNKPLP
jgi:hypothetical protein